MALFTQGLSCTATAAGGSAGHVFAASGQGGLDSAYPTARLVLPVPPALVVVGNSLSIDAMGARRFTGRITAITGSSNPPTCEILGAGWLSLAELHLQTTEDGQYPDEFLGILTGTDQNIVTSVLNLVSGLSFTSGNILGTGLVLDPDNYDDLKWNEGESALSYIRRIDAMSGTGYRTYQRLDGTIVRTAISQAAGAGVFTFSPTNTFPGAAGGKDTRTRANVSTYDKTALTYGASHTVSLSAAIGVTGAQWCQGITWSIDAESGWTQTANHGTGA